MATKNHGRGRQNQHRLMRRIFSEWAIVFSAHTLAVTALVLLERVFVLPCAR